MSVFPCLNPGCPECLKMSRSSQEHNIVKSKYLCFLPFIQNFRPRWFVNKKCLIFFFLSLSLALLDSHSGLKRRFIFNSSQRLVKRWEQELKRRNEKEKMDTEKKFVPTTVFLPSDVNFTNISWAAFAPLDLHWSFWCTA